MQKNVGGTDRTVRVVLAVAIGVLVFAKVVTGTLAVVAGVAAVVIAATGLIGWCGLYAVLGINTASCCGSSSEGEEKKDCCCGGHKE